MPAEGILLPTVAQDAETGRVLMLAYSNAESLRLTLQTGQAHYWSRSRGRLWRKGETSGNTQSVQSVALDCDGDTLLFRVQPAGPACHTGETSCFFTAVTEAKEVFGSEPGGAAGPSQAAASPSQAQFFDELFALIQSRKKEKPDHSYTARLMDQGVDRIGKKIAEEAGEVIIAAKNDSREELLWESADLIYHLMVLLASRDIEWSELAAELQKRKK
jgi:phosphoribosyl-ATP pyrophosphohydrolase/phosphoribosyl-AMP cyclohydrolase